MRQYPLLVAQNASADAPPTSSSSQTSTRSTKKNLDKFPAEIHVKIFTLVFSEPWNKNIPSLIKVLSSDKKLYPESNDI